eukprot:CAMPEP_0178535442 /NCGR_PEP_ID=MMETSP0696-20121128/35547_1 /TAXON_ID=265572 /ORGANISM="Extubocellulus spinifer, Strain CCMP396" /LENGTH=149 /DNA_ID=CAMNT_0020167581 /DNA_START=406 /DNA_END=856 /DNA_ORIENTATION=-
MSSLGYQLLDAAYDGRVDDVRSLLRRGANIHAVDKWGETPLHKASIKGHDEVAKMLLDAGANVNAANNDGATPLHAASANGHDKVARVLLDEGADINATNEKGETPLDLAKTNNKQEEMKANEKGAGGEEVAAEFLTKRFELLMHDSSK